MRENTDGKVLSTADAFTSVRHARHPRPRRLLRAANLNRLGVASIDIPAGAGIRSRHWTPRHRSPPATICRDTDGRASWRFRRRIALRLDGTTADCVSPDDAAGRRRSRRGMESGGETPSAANIASTRPARLRTVVRRSTDGDKEGEYSAS